MPARTICGFCGNIGYVLGIGGVCAPCAGQSWVAIVVGHPITDGFYLVKNDLGPEPPSVCIDNRTRAGGWSTRDLAKWTKSLRAIAARGY